MEQQETTALAPDAWCESCAQRIGELEPEISQVEARRIARDVYAFERTQAMGPIGAAEFIAVEMSRPERGPFERRASAR